MPFETFLALFVFAAVASLTPGPNNLMLLASGVNFGFRRTIPHMLGVSFGFGTVLLGIGFGLGSLFLAFPAVNTVLKFAGAGYLLYLAYRIATSRGLGKARQTARPMTFLEAAMFQWVNPKAWMMAVAAMTIYTDPSQLIVTVFLVALAFMMVTGPTVSIWTGFGLALRGWLDHPARLRWFNIVMGVLLALTLIPMLR